MKTYIFLLLFIISGCLFPYIDPGTGSALFSILFAILGTLFFLLKAFIIKIKTFSFIKNKDKNIDKKAKIIIYGEDKRYYNLFKPIVEELIKLQIPIIYYSMSEDDNIFNIESEYLHSEYIGIGNKAYAKLNFIEADICLMTTPNLDVFQLKKSKGVKKYVHITHSPGSIGVYKMYSLDFFDCVFLNGGHQIADIRELEKLRNTKEKDLYVVGSPYLDELLKNINSKKAKEDSILIAPSWGPNGLLRKFGRKIIDSLKKLNYNIIVRPHPQSLITEKYIIEELKDIYQDSIEWDYNSDSSYSFVRSKVMVSDFSGVIFDYSFLCEKPVFIPYFEYSKEGFESYFLKDDIWQFKTLPKISINFNENNIDKLNEIIEKSLNDKKLKEEILKAKKEAYSNIYNGGKLSANILSDMLTNKQ